MKALAKQKPRGEQFRAKDRFERDLIYLTLQACNPDPNYPYPHPRPHPYPYP